MPTRSINSSQLHQINNGKLDQLLNDTGNSSDYGVVKFEDLANTLAYVAAVYVDKLSNQLNAADSTSSGALADKTIPLDVQVFGTVYSCEIQTLKYAKFIDEGVSGWAKNRGSQFSFKKSDRKRGEPFTGKSDFVDSIKAYLIREGSFATVKNKITVSAKETKRKKITDTTTQAAIRVAYMIKRQGIAPTHYWQKATEEMTEVVQREFAAALRVDIINNFGN